ncbi:acyltransferase family protein [Cellulosimicrobium protaetiae]|uniref:Acyltransferase n=1 Tax=Cellulosimicrobium protaetiae TaxID=2587808 RepID=A0A6M5UEA7_9MICO|nr:acyltransferase [Cellulosimicrobium protaetiae]QJW35992.1 acyltransferase [Cellulosimicrobium protaetiae]
MKPPPAGRFLPIDAMRGAASVSVLLFHLFRSPPQADVLAATFPAFWVTVSDLARSGVAVFFVISGFVIAYTTRDLGTRARDGARFALRRQVRLDPPYYVMIAVVVALSGLERLVPGLETRSFSAGDVLLNMVYLQDIVGAEPVLAVAWTLCLEVQFYLVVVLLVWITGRVLPGPARTAARGLAVSVAAIALGVVSLALPFLGTDGGPWFIGTWWMFCYGAVVAWFMIGRLPFAVVVAASAVVGLWCLAVTLWAPVADPWGSHWFAWLTGVTILALLVTRTMSWRPPRAVLYLGTLSYSLYLVHLPVVDTVMAGAYKVTGESAAGALAAYVVAGAVAFGAAAILHRWVETPAMHWATRLKDVDRHTLRAALVRTRRRGPTDSPAPEPAVVRDDDG